MIAILVQFVFRLTFGMAVAMCATPSSLVTSGFYRVHLWVLMGLNTFAALALYPTTGEGGRPAFLIGIGAAALSYVAAVAWLYEAKRLGTLLLAAIAAVGLAAIVQFAAVILVRIEPGIGVGAVLQARRLCLDLPHQAGELVQHTGAVHAGCELRAVGGDADVLAVVNFRPGSGRAVTGRERQG